METTSVPPGSSIVTSVFTAPGVTVLTFPLIMFRALNFIADLPFGDVTTVSRCSIRTHRPPRLSLAATIRRLPSLSRSGSPLARSATSTSLSTNIGCDSASANTTWYAVLGFRENVGRQRFPAQSFAERNASLSQQLMEEDPLIDRLEAVVRRPNRSPRHRLEIARVQTKRRLDITSNFEEEYEGESDSRHIGLSIFF